MDCQEIQSFKHAFADGEMDLVRMMEIEKHLGGCPACAQSYENVQVLKSAVKSNALYFKAPADFKRQIRESLRKEPKHILTPQAVLRSHTAKGGRSSPSSMAAPRRVDTPMGFTWHWLRMGIPIAATALIAFLFLSKPATEDRLAQEITSSHIRSLMANHRTDVASSDQHTVKPWFDGKLDFAPPVIDLAERGFPLAGGRLDYVQNRPVAALVYQRRQHFINLFIWPASRDSYSGKKMEARQGYNLIHWNNSGMTCWAVSDLNPRELKDFAELIDGENTSAVIR